MKNKQDFKEERIKCLGCGAFIQTDDPNKEGYIDKKVLEKKTSNLLCQAILCRFLPPFLMPAMCLHAK